MTDGVRTARCCQEEIAEWLCDLLNRGREAAKAAGGKRGPTCREFAYGIGRDQSRAMGIPLTDEPLSEWEARMKAAKAGGEV